MRRPYKTATSHSLPLAVRCFLLLLLVALMIPGAPEAAKEGTLRVHD